MSPAEQLVSGVGVGVHGVAENFLGELDELRGLGHEVGLGVQLDGVAGLAIGGLDDLGGDGAFLSLAAFTLAGCGDTLGADDFLGAGDVAFGFLTSSMPAPVSSRTCLISAAVIAAIDYSP